MEWEISASWKKKNRHHEEKELEGLNGKEESRVNLGRGGGGGGGLSVSV